MFKTRGCTFGLAMASNQSGMRPPRIEKCANPDCRVEFKRLGTGKIYTLAVTQPQAWGLPANIKQKVVWLCSQCVSTKEVEFDEQHFQVRVVSRQRSQRQTA
jgi:hypothetical protein